MRRFCVETSVGRAVKSMISNVDPPPASDLGLDLFLLRFLDRFGRQRGLGFALGGFLGEPQFPQASGVLGNERVALGDLRHGGFPLRRDALALFLGDFLAGAIVI